MFFFNKRFKSFTKFPLVKLDMIEKRKNFSENQIFGYGTYFGITLIFTIIAILAIIQFELTSDTTFLEKYWPIFRGTFLINMYTWFIGLNIHIWEKYNVNYKVQNCYN
jgi:hypothetical protein